MLIERLLGAGEKQERSVEYAPADLQRLFQELASSLGGKVTIP